MTDDSIPFDPREPRVLRIPAVRRTLRDLGACVEINPVTPESIALAKAERDKELAEVQAVLDAYEVQKTEALQQLGALLETHGYMRLLSLLDLKAGQLGILR